MAAGTRALAALVALILAGGCASTSASEQLDSRLAELNRRFAELERQTKAAPESSAPPIMPGAPPAGPPPDPSAPPPLPVVKLQKLRQHPVDRNGEPTIRIGRHGKIAPPASNRKRPLTYARIDESGNLVDEDGKLVYRAGKDSPPIDTKPEEAAPARSWEDPHEAPSVKVDRSLRAPTIQGGNAKPGVAPVPPPPRLKQTTIDDSRMPDLYERQEGIRVDDRPPRRATAPSRYEDDEPPINVTPPARRPEIAPVPVPVEAGPPMPTAVQPTPSVASPQRAPGPDRTVVKQRTYKGSKQRRAERLYKKGLKRFMGGDSKRSARDFQRFLKKYADHELADNALYWLGETAYSAGEWLQALSWFQDVLIRYPSSNKVPDAMVKSALCYAQLGDASYAEKILSDVEAMYPSKPVAEVARKRRIALAKGGSR